MGRYPGNSAAQARMARRLRPPPRRRRGRSCRPPRPTRHDARGTARRIPRPRSAARRRLTAWNRAILVKLWWNTRPAGGR